MQLWSQGKGCIFLNWFQPFRVFLMLTADIPLDGWVNRDLSWCHSYCGLKLRCQSITAMLGIPYGDVYISVSIKLYIAKSKLNPPIRCNIHCKTKQGSKFHYEAHNDNTGYWHWITVIKWSNYTLGLRDIFQSLSNAILGSKISSLFI